jgi:hypothetical protein
MATQWNYDFSPGEVLTAGVMDSLGAVSETYTPVWSAAGLQPNIGNGTLSGRYFRINKMVFVEILFTAGSTTTYGTGIYRFSVPFTARAGLFGFMSNGIARVYDSSVATAYFGQSGFYLSDYGSVVVYLAPTGQVTNTTPFLFANSDEIILSFWYEAA